MSLLARLLPGRQPRTDVDPRRGLQAAAEWLACAQDATGSGGVSAHYDAAKNKWVGAYPETTGYIIPTFFRYADCSGNDEYRERAVRMAAWESDIQLADGGVRAGTLDATQLAPTILTPGRCCSVGWRLGDAPATHASATRWCAPPIGWWPPRIRMVRGGDSSRRLQATP